jgi:hypothetical protein
MASRIGDMHHRPHCTDCEIFSPFLYLNTFLIFVKSLSHIKIYLVTKSKQRRFPRSLRSLWVTGWRRFLAALWVTEQRRSPRLQKTVSPG